MLQRIMCRGKFTSSVMGDRKWLWYPLLFRLSPAEYTDCVEHLVCVGPIAIATSDFAWEGPRCCHLARETTTPMSPCEKGGKPLLSPRQCRERAGCPSLERGAGWPGRVLELAGAGISPAAARPGGDWFWQGRPWWRRAAGKVLGVTRAVGKVLPGMQPTRQANSGSGERLRELPRALELLTCGGVCSGGRGIVQLLLPGLTHTHTLPRAVSAPVASLRARPGQAVSGTLRAKGR